jgi:hypothetical protein
LSTVWTTCPECRTLDYSGVDFQASYSQSIGNFPPPEGIEVSRRGLLDPLPVDAVLVTGIDDLISDLDYALSAASALSARPRVQ